MTEISNIVLKANVSDIQNASNELDKFADKAQKAGKGADELNSVFRAGTHSSKQNSQSLKEQQQELQNLLNRINPTNKAFEQLDKITTQLSVANKNGLLPTDQFRDYNAILDQTRDRLTKTSLSMTDEGRALLQQEQAAQRAAIAQQSLLKSISEQAATFRASKSDALEYKAAMMGVSDEAAPFIAQVRQRELSIASEAEANRLAAQALKEKQAADRQAAAESAKLQAQNDNFITSLKNQSQAIGKSKADFLEMQAAQRGLSAESAPYISALREQERAVAREADQKRAAAIASRGLREAIAQQEAAERAEAAELKRSETMRQSFINSLQDQANAINKTRSEILEMKAAQLGVTTQASPFIARLREQESAFRQGSITAGQYRQAMRQLPMQITDVVTSLASGMPIYMVAIQQGGQIKDSFGGIGNSLKALGSLITPARVAMGGLAAAFAVVGKAGYDFYSTFSEINLALIKTGNYSNTSAVEVMNSAKLISSETGASISSVTELMTSLIQTGSLTSKQLQKAAKDTSLVVSTGLVSADDMVKAYQDIEKDPVKALQTLNEQYNFLTLSQLKQVDELVKQKRYTDATTEAMNLFGDTMSDRGKQAYEALTPFGRLWIDVKAWASDAMDSIGRTVAELAANTLKEFNAIYYGVAIAFNKLNEVVSGSVVAAIEAIPEWARPDKLNDFLAYNKEMQASNQKTIKGLQSGWDEANRQADKYLKTTDKIRPSITANDREEVRNFGKGSRKTKSGSASYTDDAATRELQASQERLAVMRQQAAQTDTMTDGERRLLAFNQQITDLKEKRQLTADQKSLLANQSAIRASLQQEASLSRQIAQQKSLNEQHQKALKYIDQQNVRSDALEDSRGVSSRETQRNKERRQLTLANFSPDDYKAASKAQEAYYAKEDEMRGDWLSGAKAGWSEYLDAATNVYSSVQSVATSAFSGVSDMLTNLVTTGTASFKQFSISILKMIVDIINKLLVAYAVQEALGWVSGSASTGGASNNAFSGGAYSNLPLKYSGGYVPAYDAGGYTGDGGKYEPKGVVHGGEFVFTKEATRSIGVDTLYAMMRGANGYADGGYVGKAPMYGLTGGNTGGGVMVNMGGVNVSSDNNSAQQTGSGNSDISGDIMKQLKPVIISTINEQAQKQATPLWYAIQGKRS